jgi:hypothetical protein
VRRENAIDLWKDGEGANHANNKRQFIQKGYIGRFSVLFDARFSLKLMSHAKVVHTKSIP